MNNLITKYGELKGISSIEEYSNGVIKTCTINELNKLNTPKGILIPMYDIDQSRRKDLLSIDFHNNGVLKKLDLQDQTPIETPLGTIPAEQVSFYKNGNIRRIFPLNGKLSGYWSEENEYSLAKAINFKLPIGEFTQKAIGILFYETGELKSITFWPNDTITIETPLGTAMCRIGLSFYKSGAIKSFEPNIPIKITTPVGIVTAYDNNPLGIHGDSNSVEFYEDGTIKGLITASNRILVTDERKLNHVYKPTLVASMLSDSEMEISPLKLEFYENKVRFNKDSAHEYSTEKCEFAVSMSQIKISSGCSDCSSCSGGCH